MTSRDHKDIQNLYFIHRFSKSSIARLYGVSHVRIGEIITTKNVKNSMSISDICCMLCGLEEEIFLFHIDGNDNNYNPQNTLMLCEADRRRIKHLQLRRRIKSQA